MAPKDCLSSMLTDAPLSSSIVSLTLATHTESFGCLLFVTRLYAVKIHSSSNDTTSAPAPPDYDTVLVW